MSFIQDDDDPRDVATFVLLTIIAVIVLIVCGR